MIPATVAVGGLKEGILVALLFIGLNLHKDHTESKPVDIINGSETVTIFSKGSYFCPFYCEVNHVHRAHRLEYKCGLENCLHYTIKEDSLKNIIKVKKSCKLH